ncbi:hypothetical protein [Rubritalea tangerina]|uniref:hypothetical protein n=1 Tax=Rubritalea tangerina TaxID=430798 RepID=UPI003614A61E
MRLPTNLSTHHPFPQVRISRYHSSLPKAVPPLRLTRSLHLQPCKPNRLHSLH